MRVGLRAAAFAGFAWPRNAFCRTSRISYEQVWLIEGILMLGFSVGSHYLRFWSTAMNQKMRSHKKKIWNAETHSAKTVITQNRSASNRIGKPGKMSWVFKGCDYHLNETLCVSRTLSKKSACNSRTIWILPVCTYGTVRFVRYRTNYRTSQSHLTVGPVRMLPNHGFLERRLLVDVVVVVPMD